MKILMLNYEFPPIGGGGGHAHLCLLRQYAGQPDLQVDVLTSAPQPGFFSETFADNITIFKVGLHKKDLHFWRRVEVFEWLIKAKFHYRKMLRDSRYDLAHAFFGFPTGRLCYKTAEKLPYIVSLRGSDVPGQHARLKLDYMLFAHTFKAIWRNADALVACSQGLKERALSFLPSVSIDVIPNGVELQQFHPAENSERWHEASLHSEPLKLLTVGRLSVTKRIGMLIETVEILHRAGCNVRLTVVGGGSAEPRLKRLVQEKGLGNIIKMTGRIDSGNMPQLYRQNHVFVSASMQEGMSNAMLEAIASGLPIVTTRCEGVEELIADNGIVVQSARAQEVASAIKRLADQPDQCKRMARSAKERAEKFGWDKAASGYIELYDKILS